MTPAPSDPAPAERSPAVTETPQQAAARHPELARHAAESTATDTRGVRRLLWKEAAAVAVIALLLVARAIWFA